MDRETLYNGWAKDKTFITPEVTRRKDNCTIEVTFQGRQYRYTAYQENMFGSANVYNIAFNHVLSELKAIDKNVELKYDSKYESPPAL